jgi:hypothetical protein
MFMRPVVKRMFQHGTGLRVEDWQNRAQAMTRRLETAASAGEPGVDGAELAAYRSQLRRLAEYFVKQEADARSFFKEPARLQAALDALRARQGTVRQLMSTLGSTD